MIGTAGPHSFDFQIMDTTKQDKNILSPQNIDSWTSVTVDTFGKVGYDKAGTLIGNWFRVGRDKNNRDEYWTENLSIVYDHKGIILK